MAFFYQLERKKGETMTEWIARHSERLWEASRALQRVQREHGRLDVPSEKEWRTLGPATVEQVKETQEVRKCASVIAY